jgi:hypothetical protein
VEEDQPPLSPEREKKKRSAEVSKSCKRTNQPAPLPTGPIPPGGPGNTASQHPKSAWDTAVDIELKAVGCFLRVSKQAFNMLLVPTISPTRLDNAGGKYRN